MYRDDFEKTDDRKEQGEDVFSKPIRAGKRTYFFDVKSTRGGDFYLTITESKRRQERDGSFTYDKHKIFLYKEDFEKFSEGLQEVIKYVKDNCAQEVVERRSEDKFSSVEFESL
ncbi:MAG: PUR family DNA/RNA-binding protein [Bacteroidales bacterium]|nr:PUR family DNA/RNA-binding protein [Bacteroidales bacterium]